MRDLWQYQQLAGEVPGGAGPSDPDGQHTFPLAHDRPQLRRRRGLTAAVVASAIAVGPLDVDVADTSTEWIPAQTPRVSRIVPSQSVVADQASLTVAVSPDDSTEWIHSPPTPQPLPWRDRGAGTPEATLDLADGPSDPDGEQTFGLVVAPDRLNRLRRPEPGGWVGDPDLDFVGVSDGTGEQTFGFVVAQARLNRLRRPEPGGWVADALLDASAPPSDPDGQHTFGLEGHPARIHPRPRPGQQHLVVDLTITADASTEWLPEYPDRFPLPERRQRSTFGDPLLETFAAPSDPDGQHTFGLIVAPSRLARRPDLAGVQFDTGEPHTLGPSALTLPDLLATRNVALTSTRRTVSLTGRRRNAPVA